MTVRSSICTLQSLHELDSKSQLPDSKDSDRQNHDGSQPQRLAHPQSMPKFGRGPQRVDQQREFVLAEVLKLDIEHELQSRLERPNASFLLSVLRRGEGFPGNRFVMQIPLSAQGPD